MLKTVPVSSNRKTGPIAVTSRAGARNTFAPCPTPRGLHPPPALGAVLDAVPRNGQAWTYSHFPAADIPAPVPGKTVINYSADTMDQAVDALALGRPAVVAAPAGTEWAGGVEYRGVKFVQCPAELSERFTCQQCGNGRPLCARPERDYVIVFVAHGPNARRVGMAEDGGCYASTGPTAIQWHGTRKSGAANDAQALRSFARSLPPGSFLRHHVAGDLGQE